MIHIALLRAVNVGGTGKLPMAQRQAMCEAEGYAGVRTYIASGNVVFHTGRDAAQVKAALERRLQQYAGKPVQMLVRTTTARHPCGPSLKYRSTTAICRAAWPTATASRLTTPTTWPADAL